MTSFGVPRAADPDCLTSCSANVPQFDAKGNRPNAESLALFQQARADRDRTWAAYRRGEIGAP